VPAPKLFVSSPRKKTNAAEAALVIKRRYAVGEEKALFSVDRFEEKLSGLGARIARVK